MIREPPEYLPSYLFMFGNDKRELLNLGEQNFKTYYGERAFTMLKKQVEVKADKTGSTEFNFGKSVLTKLEGIQSQLDIFNSRLNSLETVVKSQAERIHGDLATFLNEARKALKASAPANKQASTPANKQASTPADKHKILLYQELLELGLAPDEARETVVDVKEMTVKELEEVDFVALFGDEGKTIKKLCLDYKVQNPTNIISGISISTSEEKVNQIIPLLSADKRTANNAQKIVEAGIDGLNNFFGKAIAPENRLFGPTNKGKIESILKS